MATNPPLVQAQSDDPCTHAKSSCNEDRSICCDWWVIDLQDGSGHGAILEDSYEKLQKSLASNRKTAESLCKWGFSSNCNTTYGPPHCSGTNAARAEGVARSERKLGEVVASAAQKGVGLLENGRVIQKFLMIKKFVDGIDFRSVRHTATNELALVRKALMADHKTVDEYTTVLKEGVDRARSLRTQVDACYRSINPFRELDQEELRGRNLGYGFPVPSNDLPLPSAGPPSFGYGPFTPPSVVARQTNTSQDAIHAFEGLARQADAVGRRAQSVQQATVTSPSWVRSDSRFGHGRLLIGDLGSVDDGDSVAAGALPIAFLTLHEDESVAFGQVSITQADDGPAHVMKVSGRGDLGNEALELVSCRPGTTWNGSGCACPAGQTWSGQQCGCPNGLHLEAGVCRGCAANSVWSGAACVCPGGTSWDGNSCAAPPAPQPAQAVPGPRQGTFSLLGECGQFALTPAQRSHADDCVNNEHSRCVVFQTDPGATYPSDTFRQMGRSIGMKWCSGFGDNTELGQGRVMQCCHGSQ
jgi:hypothetical protein